MNTNKNQKFKVLLDRDLINKIILKLNNMDNYLDHQHY
jgi:hypothetical protein